MSTPSDGAAARRVFDRLASEYYDDVKHPTTASFRAGSDRLLRKWLRGLLSRTSIVCEIGAGKSSLLPLIAEGLHSPACILLIDFSFGMLRHTPSGFPDAYGVVADATRLPMRADAVDLLVAPLGAPFNHGPFWTEAARVVRAGGHVVYTGPAHEWALGSRDGVPMAEYVVADSPLSFPSWTRPAVEQERVITNAGFELVDEDGIRASELGAVGAVRASPAGEVEDSVMVSGILVRKAPR